MNEATPPTDYKDVRYIIYPAIIVPKVDGLRMLAIYSESDDYTTLFNGEKVFKYPEISNQLNKLLRIFPRVVLDGVLSIKGKNAAKVSKALEANSPELTLYIIDAFIRGMDNEIISVRAFDRLLTYDEIQAYFHSMRQLKEYDRFEVLPYYRIGNEEALKQINNMNFRNGYKGSFVRTHEQESPFIESKYKFIKILGRL